MSTIDISNKSCQCRNTDKLCKGKPNIHCFESDWIQSCFQFLGRNVYVCLSGKICPADTSGYTMITII